QDMELSVSLHQSDESLLAADIAFRSLQRISLATAQRLERLMAKPRPDGNELAADGPAVPEPSQAAGDATRGAARVAARDPMHWLRAALGWGPSAVARPPFYGEK